MWDLQYYAESSAELSSITVIFWVIPLLFPSDFSVWIIWILLKLFKMFLPSSPLSFSLPLSLSSSINIAVPYPSAKHQVPLYLNVLLYSQFITMSWPSRHIFFCFKSKIILTEWIDFFSLLGGEVGLIFGYLILVLQIGLLHYQRQSYIFTTPRNFPVIMLFNEFK